MSANTPRNLIERPRLQPSRRQLLAGAGATVSSALLPGSWRADARERTAHLRYAGLNLAGGEFGKPPGRYGHDYILPSRRSFAACATLGFNLVRLPFLWERIQPRLMQPLHTQELARLRRVATDARELGLHLVLDLHNYARRKLSDDGWTREYVVGSDRLPAETLADVWARLALGLGGAAGDVSFGLMNEPHGLPADSWLRSVNTTISAIRGTGAGNLVLVPGVAWTGAHSWMRSGNAIMAGVDDPARNYAIEVHQYLDADSSGTTADTISPTIGSERIASFEAWARENKVSAFLGEFGIPDTPVGLAALDDLCAHMAANADVWLGWAAWAAGPWWPESYHFRLEPRRDGRLPEPLTRLAWHAAQVTRHASRDHDPAGMPPRK